MKFRSYDVAEFLNTEEEMTLYLNEVLAENNLEMTLSALGDIARAKNMSELARQTGMSRKGLYQALSATGNPNFGTVLRIMNALNLSLEVKPKITAY